MNTTSKVLTESVLRRLTNAAITTLLGATPAGYRLYQKLGFETVCTARVWVSGDTQQA